MQLKAFYSKKQQLSSMNMQRIFTQMLDSHNTMATRIMMSSIPTVIQILFFDPTLPALYYDSLYVSRGISLCLGQFQW